MQHSLIRIKITQQIPANLDSADLKVIGLADDSHQYALKRLADHQLLPITEWVGYHLSRAVGLATPDFAPVWLDEETPAFGSRLEQIQQLGLPPNQIQIAQYLGPSMRAATEPIFAVDAFLPNEDRHARNFMWRTSVTGNTPLAFDFSRAWLIGGLPFGAFPLNSEHATMRMWDYLKNTFAYSSPVLAMKKIESLPDDWLDNVINAAPPQWHAGFDIASTITFWKTQRQARCASALAML
jgi:hypothetical protein